MASILLLDDDETFRAIAAACLRSAGHAVDEAPDGKAGLKLYRAGQYDLVITDIVMPGMEGLELIETLRHATPRPRIIALSGHPQFAASIYLPAAKQLGAQRTLIKPFLPDIMLQAVAEVLAKPPPPTGP